MDPVLLAKKLARSIGTQAFVLRHRRKLSVLRGFDRWEDPVKRKLEAAYHEYVSTISTSRMAISLELCCLLYFLCSELRPRIVVDLGSGLSSYVFRLYQAREAAETIVYSVDDNVEWLEKTRRLLESFDLSTANLLEWSDFKALEPRVQADLILHDLAIPKVRISSVSEIIKFAQKATLIIFDDMHRGSLREAATQLIRRNNLRYDELRTHTLDQFGRFQWCVFFRQRGNG